MALRKSNSARAPKSPCTVVRFRNRPVIGPNSVVHIDMRPGRENPYRARLLKLSDNLAEGKAVGELRLASATDPAAAREELQTLVDQGLAQEWFGDTHKIAEWIGAVNRFARLPQGKVLPLELVVCHGDSHMGHLTEAIVRQNVRPAGIIISGSPKMLSEDLETDSVLQKALWLTREALSSEIPILGICFGLHLLAKARYEVLPEWLRVSTGMKWEYHTRIGEYSRAQSGTRKMVYGSRTIKPLRDHPVLAQVNNVPGLKVHSQYFPPELFPEEAVLAVSERIFTPEQLPKSWNRFPRQQIVEVLSAGPVAIGIQLHPELTPEHLTALTYFPELGEWLQREGYDLDILRAEFASHPRDHYAGARVGYNFVKRVLAPAYFESCTRGTKMQRRLLEKLESHRPEKGGKKKKGRFSR